MTSARTLTTSRKALNITRFGTSGCKCHRLNTAKLLSSGLFYMFYVQLFLDYTAETYSKFMQGEDSFEDEEELFLSKLSEDCHQYDPYN